MIWLRCRGRISKGLRADRLSANLFDGREPDLHNRANMLQTFGSLSRQNRRRGSIISPRFDESRRNQMFPSPFFDLLNYHLSGCRRHAL